MTFLVSPGVYPRVEDISQRAPNFPTSIGGVGFASKRGPTRIKTITNKVSFLETYGPPTPADVPGFGHDTALLFLEESNRLYCRRVVGTGAKYSFGAIVCTGGSGYSSSNPPTVTFTGGGGSGAKAVPIIGGKNNDKIIQIIMVNKGSGYTSAPTITFVGGVSGGSGAEATAVVQGGKIESVNLFKFATHTSSETDTLNQDFEGVSSVDDYVALGNLFTEDNDDIVLYFIAENPGDWADKVWIDVPEVNEGIQQKLQLRFSDSLGENIVAANHPEVYIDGDLQNINFGSNNDNNDILSAIQTHLDQTYILKNLSAEVVDEGIVGSPIGKITITDINRGFTSIPTIDIPVASGGTKATVQVVISSVMATDTDREDFALSEAGTSFGSGSTEIEFGDNNGNPDSYTESRFNVANSITFDQEDLPAGNKAKGHLTYTSGDITGIEVDTISTTTYRTDKPIKLIQSGGAVIPNDDIIEIYFISNFDSSTSKIPEIRLINNGGDGYINPAPSVANDGIVFSGGGSGTRTGIAAVLSETDDRQINITTVNSKESIDLRVVSKTSGVTATVTETRQNIPSDDSYKLRVFEGEKALNPVEEWFVTAESKRDGFGQEFEVSYRVNEGPNESSRIRVVVPSNKINVRNTLLPKRLAKGVDGEDPTTAQFVAALTEFENTAEIDGHLLLNAGYTDTDHQNKLRDIAIKRRDSFAILDLPVGSQKASDASTHRREEMNLNSSYAAIYGPDIKIFDEYTGKQRWVPVSGAIGAQIAYTERNQEIWFAPAGMNRGVIRRAIDVRYKYDEGERDILQQAQINPIVRIGNSLVVWGEKTAQVVASSLQSVPVRLLLNNIEKSIANTLNESVFDPNSAATRFRVRSELNDFLEPIRRGEGLERYEVKCDEENNPPEVRQQQVMNVDVYLTFVLPALYIRLTSIVTKSSASFEEIISLRQAA